ncbi:MAG: glycosyltransferase family 2 protein [Betaproteobacteria bacterium]
MNPTGETTTVDARSSAAGIRSEVARVAAIVVSYQPKEPEFRRLIDAIQGQVALIVIVDNGSSPEKSGSIDSICPAVTEIIRLGRNFGIGHAHNIGIRWALTRDASHVLLFDQDSEPSPDMVAKLLASEAEILAQGTNLGAVGPLYYDPRLDRTWPFYALTKFGVRPQYCGQLAQAAIRCDLLITSGTLIRLAVIEKIGMLCEEFFIEHVDTEWSLRARFNGFSLFGVCSARMLHTLGDSLLHLPFVRRPVQLYGPQRYYYAFRNAVLLWRMPQAVLPWKVNELMRLATRVVLLGIFAPQRLERLGMMALGVWHGLLGKSGKLQIRNVD